MSTNNVFDGLERAARAHAGRIAPDEYKPAPLSSALRLEPWERFMLLSHAIDEVDPAKAGPLLPLVASAAMVVIRLQQGKATQAEALAAIERARVACEEARRPSNETNNVATP